MKRRSKESPGSSQLALTSERFLQDVLIGLSQTKKILPCKYFYDEQGARLFEAICQLEEYYPTRTELRILREHIDEIVSLLGPGVNLVDLGSGSGEKTRLLFRYLDRPATYFPVDVAQKQLLEGAARLREDYPHLKVIPVCADYTNGLTLPAPPARSGRTVVFFPGSTLGNFEPKEAVRFLKRLARICGTRGGLLIGVDLEKPRQLLDRAYNDSKNITAQFNLNLLVRARRELEASFDPSQFQHKAFYNEAAHRIEMHLISRARQSVRVDGHTFAFAEGESILTEHSYKYTIGGFRRLAARAGYEVVRYWTDDQRWFSLQYLQPNQPRIAHAGPAGK